MSLLDFGRERTLTRSRNGTVNTSDAKFRSKLLEQSKSDPFNRQSKPIVKKPMTLQERLVNNRRDFKKPAKERHTLLDIQPRLLREATVKDRFAPLLPFIIAPPTIVTERPILSQPPTKIDGDMKDLNKPISYRDDNVKPNDRLTGLDRPIAPLVANSAKANPAVTFLRAIGTSADDVRFSIFRFPVWTKSDDSQLNLTTAAGGIKDMTIPAGHYLFHFESAAIRHLPSSFAITSPIPFTIGGKMQIVEKAVIDPKTGRAMVQIEVVENWVMLLGLITAGLGAAGFAGYGLSSSLKQVDAVVSNSWKLALAVGIGLAAWYGIPYFFKKKGG